MTPPRRVKPKNDASNCSIRSEHARGRHVARIPRRGGWTPDDASSASEKNKRWTRLHRAGCASTPRASRPREAAPDADDRYLAPLRGHPDHLISAPAPAPAPGAGRAAVPPPLSPAPLEGGALVPLPGEARRERADGRVLEQLDRGELSAQRLSQPGADADHVNRVGSELEEALLDAHVIEPKDLPLSPRRSPARPRRAAHHGAFRSARRPSARESALRSILPSSP